jgi:molecular chaperone GrpE
MIRIHRNLAPADKPPGQGDPNVTDKKDSPKQENPQQDNPFEEPVEIEVGQAGAPAGEAEAVEIDPAILESEAVAAAQAEVARHREAMLRLQAETENTRKRLTRDLERSRRLALERIMKDLLQVVDSMERGLEVDTESATVQSLLEGQKLTLKMLGKVLQDHHLEVVDPAGEPFDPERHEAVTVLPSPDHAENTVIEVLQKGYLLHERLIRPAMVVVSGKA